MHNLSNKDLVWVYNIAKSIVDEHNEVIRSKTVVRDVIMGPNLAQMIVPVPDDVIEAHKNCAGFKAAQSVTDKLQPIIELIQEAEPELFTQDNVCKSKPSLNS